MKIIKPLLLLAIFAIVFSSCKKSGSDSSNDISTTSMSFKVNGTEVKNGSLLPVGAYYTSYGSNSLQVIGKFNASEGLNISMDNPKVGTYDVANNNNMILAYTTDSNYNNTFTGKTGKLTITAFTGTSVSGTFSFTGSNPAGDTKVITDGKFTITAVTKI